MAVSHRARSGLKVHLDGDEIVVCRRGTVFLIAFKQAPRQRRLIVTRNWLPNFASKPPGRVSRQSGSARGHQGPGAGLGRCRRFGKQAHQTKLVGVRSPAPFQLAIGGVSPALELQLWSEQSEARCEQASLMTI